MPKGYRNSDGALTGSAAVSAATGQPPPQLPVPGPGAPRTYDDACRQTVIRRLEEGEPLTRICADEGMPSVSSVYKWVDDDAVFRTAYERARRWQATSLADKAIEAAESAHDKDSAAAGRVKSDTFLKLAERLDPARYAQRPAGTGTLAVAIYTSLEIPGATRADGAYVIEVPAQPEALPAPDSVQEACKQPAPKRK